MPKYIANPVEVDALRITSIQQVPEAISPPAQRTLHLEDGSTVLATSAMLSRYIPVLGDYWVIQSDGHMSIKPAGKFEREYRLVKLSVIGDASPYASQQFHVKPTVPTGPLVDTFNKVIDDEFLRSKGFSESQITAMRARESRR